MNLPELSVDEQRHVDKVREAVIAAIRNADGFLPFDAYMELVLYAPALGYYAVGTHKLGRGGDFITAPELSPLLAFSLATQCAQILPHLPADKPTMVLEVGAGSGRLAMDLLLKLHDLNALPTEYGILEVSPDLKARQRDLLQHLPLALRDRVRWLDSLPAHPFNGVIIANEVVDALPVEWFEVQHNEWCELGVVMTSSQLALATRPATADAQRFLHSRVLNPTPGERRERRSRALPWVQSLLNTLNQGVLLAIDYGGGADEVYSADRTDGTLSTFFRHQQSADVLRYAGLCDITAWVDFTVLKDAGVAAGAALAGFTTQASFLIHTDFEQHFHADSTHPNAQDVVSRAMAARRLMLPHDMGERFKVMALSKAWALPLRGFGNDLSHVL